MSVVIYITTLFIIHITVEWIKYIFLIKIEFITIKFTLFNNILIKCDIDYIFK